MKTICVENLTTRSELKSRPDVKPDKASAKAIKVEAPDIMAARPSAPSDAPHAPLTARSRASTRTQVVIADKNPVVRAGLKDYLQSDGRFQVLGAVATGNEFLSMCEADRISVGIIGWSMPDMTGADVLAAVKRRQLATRVVVYTGDGSPSVLRQAIKDGAWGFTLKSDDPDLLIETLVSVSRGRLSLPYVDIASLTDDPLEQLTQRERQLLGALANGLTNEQIAARIGISHNTVKYHLKNLYDKLGVRNRAMAVALYMTIPEENR